MVKTVLMSELSSIKMVAGNEKKYKKVILNEVIKNWIGFGWIEERKANALDEKKFPTVVEKENEK